MIKYRFILLCSIVLITGCATINVDTKDYAGSPIMRAAFIQNGKTVSVNQSGNSSTLVLADEPFSILLPNDNEYRAIQICASLDNRIYNQLAKSKKLQTVPCFRTGTGMAPSPKGSKRGWFLRIRKGKSHNYYPESRTVNGRKYRLIRIAGMNYSKNKDKMKDGSPVYMIIFIDKNNNRVVDRNEYEFFTIKISR
ncbi:hypothetical protein ACFL2O_08515 [Thermodesulfobacteriota bacterium]